MRESVRRARNWWSRRTLRFRLALWYAAGGTLLLTAFAFTLYLYVSMRLATPLDHQLRRDLAVVEASLTIAPDRALVWKGRRLAGSVPWMTDYPWFEVWDEDGNLVRRVWPFSEDRNLQLPGPPSRTVGQRGVISVFYVAPDLRLRSLSVPFVVPDRPAHWMIRLMRVHQPHADALPDLRLIIVIALPIVVSLLVVGGHLITRRWLLPLDRMTLEADRISAQDLSRRLPVDNPHDELGRLARVFNETLDRLQESFQALDRFVADASHELRTPLTTLRSVGEVGLRRSRSVEEYQEIIGSMLEEARRLQTLVERLLELASAEGGDHVLQRERVQLDDLAATCATELGILAEQKGQRLEVAAERCSAVVDPVLLRQALQNLVDNAIKYSPAGSTIRLSVSARAEQLWIEVQDEGSGISPEHRAHLMQRFYRPDRDRGRQSGGFGLGLSITKAYLRVLGGALEYEPRTPRGSTFRLVLPKS